MINEDLPHHVRSPEDWKPIPGSLDAIARLNRAGCRVVVATNQSGVRRRCFTFEDLDRIHKPRAGGRILRPERPIGWPMRWNLPGSFHSASGTCVGCACEDDRGRIRAESADSTAHAAQIRTRRPFPEPEIEQNEMVLGACPDA